MIPLLTAVVAIAAVALLVGWIVAVLADVFLGD